MSSTSKEIHQNEIERVRRGREREIGRKLESVREKEINKKGECRERGRHENKDINRKIANECESVCERDQDIYIYKYMC